MYLRSKSAYPVILAETYIQECIFRFSSWGMYSNVYIQVFELRRLFKSAYSGF